VLCRLTKTRVVAHYPRFIANLNKYKERLISNAYNTKENQRNIPQRIGFPVKTDLDEKSNGYECCYRHAFASNLCKHIQVSRDSIPWCIWSCVTVTFSIHTRIQIAPYNALRKADHSGIGNIQSAAKPSLFPPSPIVKYCVGALSFLADYRRQESEFTYNTTITKK